MTKQVFFSLFINGIDEERAKNISDYTNFVSKKILSS